MKKLAIIVGVVAVVILVAWLLSQMRVAWDGGANVQFRFRVVDSGRAGPVKDARIRVIRESHLQHVSDTNLAGMFPPVLTDATGSATVSVMCFAGGSRGFFGKSGRFIITHELLVDADGYRPVSTALANVVGGGRWPLSKQVFDVELVLLANP